MTKKAKLRNKEHSIKIPWDIKIQCFIENHWIVIRTILLATLSYILGKFLLIIIVSLLK